jgi:predicted MPP superfamily phosphohydrolase
MKIGKLLWDGWCCISLVGIWPRFIEPRIISTSRLKLAIPSLHRDLHGFRIVQFSDLHFHEKMSRSFLKKVQRRVMSEKPDMILFTGDLIDHAKLVCREELKAFLSDFTAPYGCFAIMGNHDYAELVSVDSTSGHYDVVKESSSLFQRIRKRFGREISPTGQMTPQAAAIGPNEELIQLFSETPFTLLENESHQIAVGEAKINLAGLGEYTLGRSDPTAAFGAWDYSHPGIAMVHNPDAVAKMGKGPAELILCGHTHGCQVNLPFFRKRFTLLENSCFRKSGLMYWQGQKMYINRGVGGRLNFRWRAVPEILTVIMHEK